MDCRGGICLIFGIHWGSLYAGKTADHLFQLHQLTLCNSMNEIFPHSSHYHSWKSSLPQNLKSGYLRCPWKDMIIFIHQLTHHTYMRVRKIRVLRNRSIIIIIRGWEPQKSRIHWCYLETNKADSRLPTEPSQWQREPAVKLTWTPFSWSPGDVMKSREHSGEFLLS